MPSCDSDCMNVSLRKLARRFPEDHILLCCDGAAWHKSKALQVPANIPLFHNTPEMNPIERLCRTIGNLTAQTIRSITARQWVVRCFK
ncbi:hypothetical protein [Pyramidobacter piscolens]|nr:hypothetical protein [Pyramidobacter piscolens]